MIKLAKEKQTKTQLINLHQSFKSLDNNLMLV
jgi:hypothetical protein